MVSCGFSSAWPQPSVGKVAARVVAIRWRLCIRCLQKGQRRTGDKPSRSGPDDSRLRPHIYTSSICKIRVFRDIQLDFPGT